MSDHSEHTEAESVRTDGVLYRPCKACGRKLAFIPGPNGKAIPLDLQTPVYHVKKDLLGGYFAEKAIDQVYVSHFATCTKASAFSGKGRP